MEEQNQNNFDKKISKYASIWLWSIIFGVTATMTYNLTRIIGSSRHFEITYLPVIVLVIIAFVKIVDVWKNLLHFLNQFILPKFFPSGKEEIDVNLLNEKSIYLTNSFQRLLTVTILMFSITLYPVVVEVLKPAIWFLIK